MPSRQLTPKLAPPMLPALEPLFGDTPRAAGVARRLPGRTADLRIPCEWGAAAHRPAQTQRRANFRKRHRFLQALGRTPADTGPAPHTRTSPRLRIRQNCVTTSRSKPDNAPESIEAHFESLQVPHTSCSKAKAAEATHIGIHGSHSLSMKSGGVMRTPGPIRREHVLPVVAMCTVSDIVLIAAGSRTAFAHIRGGSYSGTVVHKSLPK